MTYYDIVIIGAGPSGLALSHVLSSLNKKILVIDNNITIGGCHRVKRVYGLFSEHGPRIYLSNYVNLFNLMKDMGITVNDIFTNYKHNFILFALKIINYFDLYEILYFLYIYILYIFNSKYGEKINLYNHLDKYAFSLETINIIDRLCRFTDGGTITKCSLNKFIKIFDNLLTTKIYQPKEPLDVSLFKIWKKFLEKRNVTFLLGKNIVSINKALNGKSIEYIVCDNKIIYLNKLILAIPPKSLMKILKYNDLHDCFGDFKELNELAEKTEYIEYISLTYHFVDKQDLENINGLTLDTDWGIIVVNLTDYMKNIEGKYNTILSCAISICDKKSKNIGKTANECSKNELIYEVHRQIKNSIYKNLSNNYEAIINPNNYYNVNDKKWDDTDDAYFHTINTKYINYNSSIINNIYTCGTHIGLIDSNYTNMESAIGNSLILAHKLYPGQLNYKYYPKKNISLRYIIILIFNILFIFIFIFIFIYFAYLKIIYSK